MVTLSLRFEPGGCTNEAYIVRLDSMEPGNAVCCGATRVFGAYVTDFFVDTLRVQASLHPLWPQQATD